MNLKKINDNLMHATHVGNLAAVMRWLDRGADVNCQNDSGTTPLMLAYACKHHQLILKLSQMGADSSMLDFEGNNVDDYINGTATIPLVDERAVQAAVNEVDATDSDPPSQKRPRI